VTVPQALAVFAGACLFVAVFVVVAAFIGKGD
jgi:hypothetical protein